MFRNNRAARIIFPLIIIAILVAVMEFVDFKKEEKKDVIIGKCTISIDCKTVLKNRDTLEMELKDKVPKDGVILKKTKVDLHKGDTAYDILYKVTKDKNISMESNDTAGNKYVKGIDNFYEFSCGPESGWLYQVNGKKPNKSSSDYKIKRNDVIAWKFTCKKGDVK
ncbi:MAG: DUF4430 domain-containing protein [Eubacterium sp.]|nr:DUF4430 domain-containing protein [Eubacterium sp.]